VIRVAVAGAAGRMGQAACGAVDGAEDMMLVARADPTLGTTVTEAIAERPDVLIDFTLPATALDNAREAVTAGVHVVIGTTGFDPSALEAFRGAQANVFVAPNFAIGAVLMMRFAAEAARHMRAAEIIELHHDRKLDAPSGTAARTAALMQAARDPDGAGIPIHSVRLPGLVAHDSIDRESFMPGVLLAVRRVAGLTQSPLIGLEHLLD